MTTADEFTLTLKLPFTQYVVPAHCRTPRPVQFSDDTPVTVRGFDLGVAETAYRVSPAHGAVNLAICPSYEILAFEDRFWWPAIWNGRNVTRTDLIGSAAGASSFAAVSIVPSTPIISDEFPRHTKIEVRKYGESGWNDQQTYANHGACDVAFFGEFLHLAAGVPVFHAIEAGGGLDMQIGTSEWSRLRPVQVLPGPMPSRSIQSAHAGYIFGLDEFEKQRRLLCDRGYGIYDSVSIERAEPFDQSDAAAAWLSARGVVDRTWGPASECLTTEARHGALPALFDQYGARRSGEKLSKNEAMYQALKEIAGLSGQTMSPALKACIGPAEDVMQRMGEIIDGDALSGYG